MGLIITLKDVFNVINVIKKLNTANNFNHKTLFWKLRIIDLHFLLEVAKVSNKDAIWTFLQ